MLKLFKNLDQMAPECHLPKGLGRCFVLNTQLFRLEKCHCLKLSLYSSFSFKSSDKIVSWVFQIPNLSVISDIVGVVYGGKWSTMVPLAGQQYFPEMGLLSLVSF